MNLHPANRWPNLKRRVNRARNFPVNTCPASRHVQLAAECLMKHKSYPMLQEAPEHMAGSLMSVVESLFKARTRIKELEARLNLKKQGEH
jgi:hypothetical protein